MMKRTAVAAGLVLAVVAALTPAQQPRSMIHSRPDLPPQAVLDRLHLRLGWSGYVPMDGMRDGLYSVDVLGRDLLVQTRSGLTVLLDAETGATRWRSRVGLPYRVAGHPVANRRNVFVVNGNFLYALDRATGAQQWDHRLPAGVTAPPVVDEEFIYFATANGRLFSYVLPNPNAPRPNLQGAGVGEGVSALYQRSQRSTGSIGHLTSVREASEVPVTGPQPVRVWEYSTIYRVDLAPLLTPKVIFVVSPDGEAAGLTKIPYPGRGVEALYTFQADGPVSVPPGQFEDMAYLAGQDGHLYAINLTTGRVHWRHTGGEAATRRPAALPQDVFLSSGSNGMSRIDRASGESLWRVPRGSRVLDSHVEADRFVAANPKFVYAADRTGWLLVLDHRLGHRLSAWDTREFVFPVTNVWTDRAYLAANSGLILCLHDREYPTPIRYRNPDQGLATQIRQALNQRVSDVGGRDGSLADVLADLRIKYDLRVDVDDQAFVDAKRNPIGPLPVKFPKVDNRPLGELLQLILDQVQATYRVADDRVLVIPARAARPPEEP
jgi:outer membrane protein assembly factor BamB